MITSFTDEYRWLSNFWNAPIKIAVAEHGGIIVTAATNEHIYQAMKCKYYTDFAMILRLPTPGRAKRAGKFIPLREDWEAIKENTMYQINSAKYAQHHDLAQRLLATGDQELIEGNTWGDHYWGVCNGKGANRLGKILMRIRKELAA